MQFFIYNIKPISYRNWFTFTASHVDCVLTARYTLLSHLNACDVVQLMLFNVAKITRFCRSAFDRFHHIYMLHVMQIGVSSIIIWQFGVVVKAVVIGDIKGIQSRMSHVSNGWLHVCRCTTCDPGQLRLPCPPPPPSAYVPGLPDTTLLSVQNHLLWV